MDLPTTTNVKEETPTTQIKEPKDSIWRIWAIAIVPMFFGTLLFSGLVESYKADMSVRKELVPEFLRPALETGATCAASQTRLASKHAEQAGIFRFSFRELQQFSLHGGESISLPYAKLLETVAKAPGQGMEDLRTLEEEVHQCKLKLFRTYIELAAVSGTYDEFKLLADGRETKIKVASNELDSMTKKLLDNNEPDKLWDTLRAMTQSDQTQTSLKSVVDKLERPISQLVGYQLERAKFEQQFAAIDEDLHSKLIALFSNELSNRNKRGRIIRWLF